MAKGKINTEWYDDLCLLYQKTRDLGLTEISIIFRDLLWDQVRGIVYSRIQEFIKHRKSALLLKDYDLSQKLFQESFFIFTKAVDKWDPNRKTKFITFIGDILDQEILNIIKLDGYAKKKHTKISSKLKDFHKGTEPEFFDETAIEKKAVLAEVEELINNFSFSCYPDPMKNQLDRDIVHTLIYGKLGDWGKLRKKYKMSLSDFNQFKKDSVNRIRTYILEKSSPKVKYVLSEIVNEK